MHPQSLLASKMMQCKLVPWVNDPRLPPHTTTCCDLSSQPSPQLHPLLLPQIVTAQSCASCLQPLQLVQALGNRLKDSTIQQPCHPLAYPPLLSQIASSDTPMRAPSYPPAPLAWRSMQIASPDSDILPSSTFSRAIGPLSPLLATTYWLPLKMLQWSTICFTFAGL